MLAPPPRPEFYRERAAECERLAAQAAKAETRETMLYLAMRWHALADEASPKTKPTDFEALPLSPEK
jgi:hypothetical protein